MDWMNITVQELTLSFHTGTLQYRISTRTRTWETDPLSPPCILLKNGEKLFFTAAQRITHRYYENGVGRGILSSYSAEAFSVETLVWIEYATQNIRFELIPGTEGLNFSAVYWPGHFLFDQPKQEAYSVMPILQGLLIPNTWPNEVRKLSFDGQLCSNTAYMPWFGQIVDRTGYIAICEQPWDAAFHIDHPAGGPYTHVGIHFLPSLGQLSYRRILRYTFTEDCDYNDLCKLYRAYALETGLLTTLAEKAARNPLVDKLIGSAIVHKGIKTHVSPDSLFYDREHPENNDVVIPFRYRTQEIRRYHEKGVEKLYLHLDGWGEPGYDNKHPDYLPACKEAGGWEGMKELSDTLQKYGYMFGLHDQYRDYYMDAETFDKESACQNPDGSIPDMARWAGGRQSYLCASQAPYYVKRNFEEVLRHGIHLEASYLDVFTCNEGDECANPHHRMTRRECFFYRGACFRYLWSKGILPSSEECVDWAMRDLVFCHYGPYDFMLNAPGTPRKGIEVPLFNLVYHDCIILPWPMDRLPDTEDYMLHALLNGGAAYLDKDGAYPGCDGAFDSGAERRLEEEISRWRIVSSLQQRIAKCEMLRHEFLDHDPKKQRTVFSDGTTVTVNFHTQSYEITG